MLKGPQETVRDNKSSSYLVFELPGVNCMKSVKIISDDIILHAQNEAKLLKILERLFNKIKSLGLLNLNKDKCIFRTDKLKFFGIEISNEGISPDKNKIKAIKHALPPSNISELRSFIGLCTYVSRFSDNYNKKTAVLRGLAMISFYMCRIKLNYLKY